MKIKISSWNVNGIRARLDVLSLWIKNTDPDILCLQETKCVNEDFPKKQFESMGYKIYLIGQKSFNGVAILSKYELTDVNYQLYDEREDKQPRFIEATLNLQDNIPLKINCIYLPNGNPYPSEKFDYKIEWMDKLILRAKENLKNETPYIILGDFNIIPTEIDVFDYNRWIDDALFTIEARKRHRHLINLGLYDAYKLCSKKIIEYTHWDYQGGAWNNNQGIRIDHILMSPSACSIFSDMITHTDVRGTEKPSDHVPITAIFDLN